MKSLFVTLFIFGGIFLALDYSGTLGERIVFKSLNKTAHAAPEPVAVDAVPAPKPVVPEPAKPAPVAAVAPASTSASPTASAVAATSSQADSTGFVTPKYETLDVLSNGWTKIPKSAFPGS